MKPAVVSIRPLTGEAEARYCAEFLAASDPWLTLAMAAIQPEAMKENLPNGASSANSRA